MKSEESSIGPFLPVNMGTVGHNDPKVFREQQMIRNNATGIRELTLRFDMLASHLNGEIDFLRPVEARISKKINQV
jgi:hypothetical protein